MGRPQLAGGPFLFIQSGLSSRMSAFGGKADMTVCGMSAFTVAIGGEADMPLCYANVGF
jgi:hypothetical protein